MLSIPLRVLLPLLLLSCAAIAGLVSWKLNTRLLRGEIEAQFLDEAKLRLTNWQGTMEYLFRKGDANGVNLEMSGMATRKDVIAAYLLDRQDRVLAATRISTTGQAAAVIETDLSADLKSRHATHLTQVRASGNGTMVLSRDRHIAVAYYPLLVDVDDHALRSVRNGLLVLVFDTHIAQARAFQASQRQALNNALVFGGLAAGAWLVIHLGLTRRVAGLVATTRQLATGDLTARTGIVGRDELAQVAKALDLMADRIAEEVLRQKQVEMELRESEQKFRQSEFRYHSLFENMWEGYAYCRTVFEHEQLRDFIYEEVNSSFERLTGLKDVVGKKVSELIPHIQEANRDIFEVYSRVALTSRPEKFETHVQGLDIWLSVTVYSSEKDHFVAVFDNITERRRAAALLSESQQRLALATESARIGIWDWDVVTNQLVWDTQMYALYGIREEDFSGAFDAWQKGLHPDDRARSEAEIRIAVNGTEGFHIEFRVVWPTGEVRHIEAHALVQPARNGSSAHMIGVNWDITERKRAEQALRDSEDLFSNAFEHAPIGLGLASPEGRWIKVNRALCNLVGYSETQLLTRTFQEMTPAEDFAADLEGARRMAIGEILSYQSEKSYIHALGHLVPIMLNVSLVRDGQGKPRYYVSQIQDMTERKRAEESSRLLGSAVEQSKESIMITDAQLDLPGPKILFVNPAFTQMTGYVPEAVVGKTPRILQGPLTDRTVLARLRQNLQQGEAFSGEAINYRKDGTQFVLEWQIAPLRGTSDTITHFVAIQRDITERKRLEAQLSHSQKLETVGKLAGGVAHEFNSMLTAIIGQSELMLEDLPPGSPLVKNATEINKAAGRAATLTRQLLAYGRKQLLQPEILDLNVVLTGMEGTLRHLLGRETDIRLAPAPGLHAVKADAGQIEQVIMNLAMNAADAMPAGGKLTLETANVTLDAGYVRDFPELKAGEYVMLAMTDTGVGMSDEVKARAFEPFFTTKGVGQGTGLGLSTCYGILRQSGGHIGLYSEVGRGSTFKIYLPQVEPLAKIPQPRLHSPQLPRGTETILLVEDDPALREMATALLSRLGYTVLAASHGIEALSIRQRDAGHVDLVFTDVVMPHMSGKELAERMRALYPHTRILLTSAYAENAIVHQGVLDPGVALLQKPFTPSALAHKLREVLDRQIAPAEPGAFPS